MWETRLIDAPELRSTRGAGDQADRLTGYAAVYYRADNPGTEFRLYPDLLERFMPGAFQAAARQQGVVALYNHDPGTVLGRVPRTLTLKADQRGLHYDVQLPRTRSAAELVELVERGDIDGSSVTFRATDEELVPPAEKGGPWIREVRAAEIRDVGPTPLPAYPATTAQKRCLLGRSCSPDEWQQLKRRLLERDQRWHSVKAWVDLQR